MTKAVFSFKGIYSLVRRIPPGRVATYGGIAKLAGHAGGARLVGYALHALPEGSDVPWHRVVNIRGAISLPELDDGHWIQRVKLEEEGVIFDKRGHIDFKKYGWRLSRK